MMLWLKQSTAAVVSFGAFVDKTDGVTLETGLVSALDHGTTGIFLSKNGGALTIRHATVTATTYDAYGMYRVTLDTTDTNTLGTLRMAFSEAATCLPVWQDCMVVPANVWDSLFGADALQVHAVEITNGLITAAAIATDAIDADAMADGAITAATFAAGAITATVIADGAIDAATFAANAITSTVIANDAITDAKVAADVTIASVTGAVGSVTGAVASVTGAVGSVTGNVGGNVTGSVGSLAAQAKADVNAEVVDALNVDTYAEPGQEAPPATTTLVKKLGYVYKSWRNKKDNDGTTTNLYADDAATVDQKQATSEAAGTVTKGEWATGP